MTDERKEVKEKVANETLDREDTPDEDFGGKGLDQADSASSDSSDEEEENEGKLGSSKKKRKEELVDLDEDEAKALQEDLGGDLRQGKRIRRGMTDAKEGEQVGSAKEGPSLQSDEVWKSIQANSENEKVNDNETEQSSPKEELVCVKKTFRFAGELVTEEKMLPKSHPEAKEFLAKQQTQNDEKVPNKVGLNTQSTNNNDSRPLPPLSSGPRRKKAGGLAAMSAAVTGKPTKLNTLEKSKMDWTKFKQSSLGEHERHEMEAQTKGGSSGLGSMKGYMERRDFLDRVQGRLEGQEKK